jgi:hypothetical protein
VKNILDKINNGRTFIQASPTSASPHLPLPAGRALERNEEELRTVRARALSRFGAVYGTVSVKETLLEPLTR